jgi:DNA-binding MarR family transcriptional regulator
MAYGRQGRPGTSRTLTIIRIAKVVELILSELGLTVAQYRMLTFANDDPAPLGELSVRLAMKPPNVTTLIDGLVARGLVTRERGRDDRRRVELALTPKGRRLLVTAEKRCADGLAYLAGKRSGNPRQLLQCIDDWVEPLDVAARELRARERRST